MATIDDLPNKVLLLIFSYIDVIKRQQYQLVCKRWQSLIRSMWQSIRKLRITSGNGIPSPTVIDETLYITDESMLESILEIFNGNLISLEFDSKEMKSIRDNCLQSFRDNENLRSVRILTSSVNVVLDFISCLPMERMQYLLIKLLYWVPNEPNKVRLGSSYNDLVSKFRGLTFLSLNVFSSSTLQTICNIETLTSLHVTFHDGEEASASIEGIENICRLSNLEALSIHRSIALNDSVLFTLQENCRKLRAIHLSECRNVSSIGIIAIAALPELRYLNIFFFIRVYTDEYLDHLSNLEEFYCDMGDLCLNTTTLDQTLHRLLLRSPNLKKFRFDTMMYGQKTCDMLFLEIVESAGRQVEFVWSPPHLDLLEWDKISGHAN